MLGQMILSPLDLERTFGLAGGDIMHGHLSLDQLWAARPVLSHSATLAPDQRPLHVWRRCPILAAVFPAILDAMSSAKFYRIAACSPAVGHSLIGFLGAGEPDRWPLAEPILTLMEEFDAGRACAESRTLSRAACWEKTRPGRRIFPGRRPRP